MTELYIYYSDYTSGGEVCEGQENDDWPNYEDEFHEFNLLGVSLQKDLSWFKDTQDVDWNLGNGSEVFILVARYSSGCTFGSSYGHFNICGVFSSEEDLIKYQKFLESDEELYKGRHIYRPWVGHFENLEGFETHRCIVGDNDNKLKKKWTR